MTILNLDSVEALKTLADGSVQLIVTSPPYDDLRSYAGHSWDFEATAREMYRVLCDGGITCWVVGDACVDGSETLTSFRQAIYFKDVVGFRVHDTMIYEKVNFSHPEKTRYHQGFEYAFILSKGKPRCFNPLKDKQNTWGGKRGGFGVNTYTEADGSKSLRNIQHNVVNEFGMRTNVWRGNTRGQEGQLCHALPHPAMMPRWLARDLILSWSNPGDLVVDPFAGSGTTGLEAAAVGRQWWLNDASADYVKQIEEDFATRVEIRQPIAL